MAFPLSEGTVNYTSGTTYGSTATVTCFQGFEMNGPENVTCQSDGTWSDSTTCDPSGKHSFVGFCFS